MKILWLLNMPPPEACILMGAKAHPFAGWVVGAAEMLSSQTDVQVSIAFPKHNLEELQIYRGEKITYYAFPQDSRIALRTQGQCHHDTFAHILDLATPDIVPIFGTENVHALAMAQVCAHRHIPSAISIQGLLSIYAGHYMANLPAWTQYGRTLKECIPWKRRRNLREARDAFIRRGQLEVKALQGVRHIIGGTTWDKACSLQANPQARYYHCNETLRGEFYKHTWRLQDCERFSISLSQGNFPIKGLHLMLEAMPLILRRFPETKVYVAGHPPMPRPGFMTCFRHSSYSAHLQRLMTRLRLHGCIVFTGMLDESQMCERLLRTHVFVSPSTVENESNSLSESKLLGVPCVASYAGGVTDRIAHGQDGFLYAWDAPYMLAHYVCEIFADDALAQTFSTNARRAAQIVNDPARNRETLLAAYATIIAESRT